MIVRLIEIAAREPHGRMGLAKPYIRGRDVNGKPLTHTLERSAEREYLRIAEPPPTHPVNGVALDGYPGSERVVNGSVLADLNRLPSPVIAKVIEVTIAETAPEENAETLKPEALETEPSPEIKDEVPNPDADADRFADYSYADLQALCKKADLNASGSKDVLKERLLEAGVVPAEK